MNIHSVKIGNKLRIKNKMYEVVSIRNDAETIRNEDNSNDFKIKPFVAIYLHELGNKHINPTHLLANYFEEVKITFSYLIEDKDEYRIEPKLIKLAQ